MKILKNKCISGIAITLLIFTAINYQYELKSYYRAASLAQQAQYRSLLKKIKEWWEGKSSAPTSAIISGKTEQSFNPTSSEKALVPSFKNSSISSQFEKFKHDLGSFIAEETQNPSAIISHDILASYCITIAQYMNNPTLGALQKSSLSPLITPFLMLCKKHKFSCAFSSDTLLVPRTIEEWKKRFLHGVSQEDIPHFLQFCVKTIQNSPSSERLELISLIKTSQPALVEAISTTTTQTLQNPSLGEKIKAVAIATATSVAPRVTLAILQLLSGNAPTALVEFETNSINDLISAEVNEILKPDKQWLQPAIATLIVGGSLPAAALCMVTSEVSHIVTDAINKAGGATKLARAIDWNTVVFGKNETPSFHTSSVAATQQLLQLPPSQQNNTLTSFQFARTLLTTALEGATIGIVLWNLGIGFSDESDFSTVALNAMVHSAFNAVFNQVVFGTQQTGALMKMGHSWFSRTLLLMSKAGTFSYTDIIPIVSRDFAQSLLDTIVEQLEGYPQAIKTVSRSLTESTCARLQSHKEMISQAATRAGSDVQNYMEYAYGSLEEPISTPTESTTPSSSETTPTLEQPTTSWWGRFKGWTGEKVESIKKDLERSFEGGSL